LGISSELASAKRDALHSIPRTHLTLEMLTKPFPAIWEEQLSALRLR
jgi:hypothetical protein